MPNLDLTLVAQRSLLTFLRRTHFLQHAIGQQFKALLEEEDVKERIARRGRKEKVQSGLCVALCAHTHVS